MSLDVKGALAGKVALVTGAARGIGAAIARALADDGAAVGLADVAGEVEDTAGALEKSGARTAFAIFDVSDAEAVTGGVESLRAALGEIDILVNNAGIVANIAPLDKMTPESWQHELSVNLSGQYYLIRSVVGAMAERGWGRIVNISSVAARGGLHRQAAYAASKAGVIGLTHTVTLEFAGRGVTCNAILPGMIATPLVKGMPSEILDNIIGATPAGRLGELDEIARAVAYLASDAAGFINGAEIDIDGGLRLNTNSLGSRRHARKEKSS